MTAQSAPASAILQRLTQVIESRMPRAGQASQAEQSYVARLLERGPDAFLKKIAEEAAEVIMAAKDADHGGQADHIRTEMADLWFHCLVALAHYGLSAQDVLDELARREGISGIAEKSARTIAGENSIGRG